MPELAVTSSEYQLNMFNDNGDFATGITIDSPDNFDKGVLVGIPLKIVTATFWIPTKGSGMVSVECYIGSEIAIKRNKMRGHLGPQTEFEGLLVVEPGERIVFNDGSTGIRRALVRHLQENGRIDVGHEKMPEDGKLGECRYDLPWAENKGGKLVPVWKSFASATAQGDVQVPHFEMDINLKKGLRPSEYENEQGENVTYYLR